MRRFIFALLSVVTCATMVAATDYVHVGNGVYQYGTNYYRIQQVYYSAGIYNGSYYTAGYYPAYVQVYDYRPASVNVSVNLPSTPPANAEELLLKEFTRIDKAIKFKQGYDALLTYARQANGLSPLLNPGYGQYSSLSASLLQTGSGNTGYVQSAGVTIGNQIDLDKAAQNLAQSIVNTGTSYDNMMKDFKDLLDGENQRRHSLMDKKLKNDAIVALAIAQINGPSQSSLLNLQQTTGPAPLPTTPQPNQPTPKPGNTDLLSMMPADMINTLWNASAQKCINCHGLTKQEGGFDLRKIDLYDVGYRTKILSRIRADADPARRMPRTDDGKAATPLSAEEFNLWLRRLSLNVPAKK